MADDDLSLDDGLNTAILVSLFSDRRAEPADELPDPGSSRRGWWGDALADGRDRLGSRLWLLTRRKQTPETRQLFIEYTKEALSWLVEDGVASTVEVDAQWKSQGFLTVTAVVARPDGGVVRFDYAWDSELEKLEVVSNAF
ncbi:MAG: phage GP46 family protein [Deltaproteobacteria bacterium]|nr:phage GP46 family protein [Deltaproteobacteria bacterium]